jgi:hypothetical protein
MVGISHKAGLISRIFQTTAGSLGDNRGINHGWNRMARMGKGTDNRREQRKRRTNRNAEAEE